MCNFLAQVAELMTGGRLRAVLTTIAIPGLTSAAGICIHLLSLRALLLLRLATRRGVQVDRKVNLLVEELRRFEIRITGISETKWFGQDVYEVDGFVLAHPKIKGKIKGGSPVSSTAQDGRFHCDGCQCSFSRSQDKARHSCDSVRSRRAAGTVSAPVACSHCWRTFRRPQDIARHKCYEPED